MILSILIPTLPERKTLLERLIVSINPTEQVEILTDSRPRGITTGEKRNDLLNRATGEYVCHVDDDDFVHNGYCREILSALESKPDCVTFEGWMTTNGIAKVDWIIKLGEKYEARQDTDGITRYYRFPNHLAAIKTSISRKARFPHVTQGEDYPWAKELNDRGLIKTSVHIPKQLYHYDFHSNK